MNLNKEHVGFPGGAAVKNLPANAGDTGDAGSIPRLKRSPGKGNDNPLQYSSLENFMERKAWQWGECGLSEALPGNRPGWKK